ncbi:cob(I)yrinic acid a,c-diamide adenosyltransferase [Paludibacter sp.]
MKIYTKTGDKGKTSLVGGTRVSKSDARLDAYGTIDELNSFVGLLTTEDLNDNILQQLHNIQNKLFSVGSYLATDTARTKIKDASIIHASDIAEVENNIDVMDSSLPTLKNFILPGGNRASSICHICRTVTRRAERNILKLVESDIEINDEILKYVNRLSDYFFVLSRYISVNQGYKENFWKM